MGKDSKRDRELLVNFDIHKDGKIKIGNYVIEIGNVSADGSDNEVDVTLFYNRPSGKPKIIEQHSLTSPKHITLNCEDVFLQYDRVFVIDTNYEKMLDKKVCAAAIGELFWSNQEKDYVLHKMVSFKFTCDYDDENNPEKYSWLKLIEVIDRLNKPDLKYGIVVDSEQNLLKSYNKGEPILNDNVLPENIKFIYATADKKDTLLNWAIGQCDKAAKKMIEEYKNAPIQED